MDYVIMEEILYISLYMPEVLLCFIMFSSILWVNARKI